MVYKHYGKDPSVEASGEALGCVLLECVSNLAANELYMEEGAKDGGCPGCCASHGNVEKEKLSSCCCDK